MVISLAKNVPGNGPTTKWLPIIVHNGKAVEVKLSEGRMDIFTLAPGPASIGTFYAQTGVKPVSSAETRSLIFPVSQQSLC
jgi:hypothetical protein